MRGLGAYLDGTTYYNEPETSEFDDCTQCSNEVHYEEAKTCGECKSILCGECAEQYDGYCERDFIKKGDEKCKIELNGWSRDVRGLVAVTSRPFLVRANGDQNLVYTSKK